MAKPFDASTKFLVEFKPTDWLRLLGLPLGPTRIAEADLSTVSTAADRLVVVDTAPTPYGLIVEFQGNVDPAFEARLLEYSVLASRRLGVPIPVVAVLLRPFAGHGALRGRHVVRGPDAELLLDFRYRVLRVWQMPPEAFLAGGLAVLPLATIARTRRGDLPRILSRIEERLETETTPSEADYLRTATFILMGLKFDKWLVEKLMNRNVLELSSTYRSLREEAMAEGELKGKVEGRVEGIAEGIVEGKAEGKVEEARSLLLRFGSGRLGPPSETVVAAVERITGLEALESLFDRLLSVESWSDLLQ